MQEEKEKEREADAPVQEEKEKEMDSGKPTTIDFLVHLPPEVSHHMLRLLAPRTGAELLTLKLVSKSWFQIVSDCAKLPATALEEQSPPLPLPECVTAFTLFGPQPETDICFTYCARVKLPLLPRLKTTILEMATNLQIGGFVRLVSIETESQPPCCQLDVYFQGFQWWAFADSLFHLVADNKGEVIDIHLLKHCKNFKRLFRIHINLVDVENISNGKYEHTIHGNTKAVRYPHSLVEASDTHTSELEIMESKLDNLVYIMNKQFDTLDKQFDTLDKQFDTLDKQLDKKFDTLDKKFDTLDKQLNKKLEQLIQSLHSSSVDTSSKQTLIVYINDPDGDIIAIQTTNKTIIGLQTAIFNTVGKHPTKIMDNQQITFIKYDQCVANLKNETKLFVIWD
ncbi:hypothetical protein QOT17_015163 [Balamuthia mandrillaris]